MFWEIPAGSILATEKSFVTYVRKSMSMFSEQAIITVLCMVYQGDEILLQDRIADNLPGVTFPGGHVEREESFVEAVKREMWEETGLTIENPILCGVRQSQSETGERYIALLFKTNQFSGLLKSSSEGRMMWVKRARLSEYSLVPDFSQLLAVFDSSTIQELFYTRDEAGMRHPKLY